MRHVTDSKIRIGLDYWQTITRDPELFAVMAQGFLDSGNEVHIITAIGPKRRESIYGDVDDSLVPYTSLHVIEFQHPRDAPQLKLDKCLDLGIDMFVDDRRDICELLNKNGILTLNVLRKDNRDYDPEKYSYEDNDR